VPSRALRPCRDHGCGALTSNGWCPDHQKKQGAYDRQQRGTSTQRGYGSAWQKYSRRYRYEHPYCEECGKIAECVDHKRPISGPDDPGMWDEKNHRSLCWSCHSRKTVTTDRRGLNNPALVR
jgi:5-methylcytosine-specific restriction protein A